MLKIRLQRVGRKHQPVFRLVLTDSKNSTKSGKSLEILGNYDSRHGENAVFKTDRITYWMGNGAQVSDTVHNILLDKKIITGKKINVLPLKKAIKKEEEVVKADSPAKAEVKAVEVEETTPEETPVVAPVAEESVAEPVA
jgi:small subunit ribosomal protein S16